MKQLRIRSCISALLMSALLALYLWIMVDRGALLFATPSFVGKALGVVLMLMPLFGVFVIVQEVRFGFRSSALFMLLDAEGPLATDEVPRLPSGRFDRSVAGARVPAALRRASRDGATWQEWMQLGLLLDASGDRRMARRTIMKAIRVEGAERRDGR